MTRITTSFGFSSMAAEVAAGVDLTGRRAIVTGASSGIGVETARVLASVGAEVTLAVRNTRSGDRVAAEIATSTETRTSMSLPSTSLTRTRSRRSSAHGTGRCIC